MTREVGSLLEVLAIDNDSGTVHVPWEVYYRITPSIMVYINKNFEPVSYINTSLKSNMIVITWFSLGNTI